LTRNIPATASVAHAAEGAKLHAPAAARNAAALVDLLETHAPDTGTALEIASGTGQHICAFAAALPLINWQPSEIDPARRASIDAHVSGAGLDNIAKAQMLDATAAGWGVVHQGKDLIVLVNLLHLISTPEARTVIREAASALASGGMLLCYGPFKRDGQLTSDGDMRFDAQLRTADPAIGYKDTLDITRWLGDAGLTLIEIARMPANNLGFVARKTGP
jgi:SAM-dependent methyltransferase